MRVSPFIALLVASTVARADTPSLKDVVRRMGAYVESYGEKAAVVVATERYTQHVTGSGRTLPQRRAIVADFAIVKADGPEGWVGFRDIVEADGARIPGREDRLLQVLSAASGRMDEARRLSDESARFNIGPISRNFNVPTTALFFFRSGNFDRFKFVRQGVETDGTWEIGFRETERPTLIRTPAGASVPMEGSLWVTPADGTVVRTRMRMTDFGEPDRRTKGFGSAQIDVTYTRIAAVGMWLPQVMTETYEVVRGTSWERTTTEAKYSNYRRFETAGRIK